MMSICILILLGFGCLAIALFFIACCSFFSKINRTVEMKDCIAQICNQLFIMKMIETQILDPELATFMSLEYQSYKEQLKEEQLLKDQLTGFSHHPSEKIFILPVIAKPMLSSFLWIETSLTPTVFNTVFRVNIADFHCTRLSVRTKVNFISLFSKYMNQ